VNWANGWNRVSSIPGVIFFALFVDPKVLRHSPLNT
jgi:hypothetical protein